MSPSSLKRSSRCQRARLKSPRKSNRRPPRPHSQRAPWKRRRAMAARSDNDSKAQCTKQQHCSTSVIISYLLCCSWTRVLYSFQNVVVENRSQWKTVLPNNTTVHSRTIQRHRNCNPGQSNRLLGVCVPFPALSSAMTPPIPPWCRSSSIAYSAALSNDSPRNLTRCAIVAAVAHLIKY